MRPTDARVWHPQFLIFNDSIIQQSEGDPRWLTLRRADAGGELRQPKQSGPRWTLELSDLQLSPRQHEELLAFQWEVQGMLNAFLCRNIRNCLFENADGVAQSLGLGDGERSSFQLRKTRPIQGRAGQVEIIRFPNFRYPALEDLNGVDWDALPQLQVFVDGALALDGFSVNRTTGVITFDATPEDMQGVAVSVKGGYYSLMVANQDGIATKPDGPMFVVGQGVSFAEPVGGTDAELEKLELL